MMSLRFILINLIAWVALTLIIGSVYQLEWWAAVGIAYLLLFAANFVYGFTQIVTAYTLSRIRKKKPPVITTLGK